MNVRALWIRRVCCALIVVQAIVLWRFFLFGLVKASLDDAPGDCGLTGKGLMPFFVIGVLLMGSLMLITWSVLRRSERPYAWVALLVIACVTALLLNWILGA